MYWLEVSVVVDGEGAEAVAEMLRPYAYGNGVVLEQRGDASKADPNALEPEVTVKVFLPEDQDTVGLRRKIEESLYHLGRLYPIPAPQFRKLVEEDWANAWRKHYQPFRVGKRLWIRPSWMKAEDSEPGDIVIAMDPGMAFGTGLHPSTQMCLQQLEALVEPGMKIMDVGTGSGILALGAAALGCQVIVANDIDPDACEIARGNIRKNGFEERISVTELPLASLPGSYDLVVANILAEENVRLKEQFMMHLAGGGWLVLSGILKEKEILVRQGFQGLPLEHISTRYADEWVCLVFRRQE